MNNGVNYENWNANNEGNMVNTEILEGVLELNAINRNDGGESPLIMEKGKAKVKQTLPIMTKYERTRIIGVRATQIAFGSPPLVNVSNLKTPIEKAEKELQERKLPIIIRRKLPNGVYEDWRVEDFEII